MGEGDGVGTVHTRMNNVRSVLRGAVSDRHMSSDPSQGVALPRRRRAEAAMTIPTIEQVGRLLRAADGPFAAYVALCAFGGLHLGEAAAVQVGDVEFLTRALHVQRQVQRENGAASRSEHRSTAASGRCSWPRRWSPF